VLRESLILCEKNEAPFCSPYRHSLSSKYLQAVFHLDKSNLSQSCCVCVCVKVCPYSGEVVEIRNQKPVPAGKSTRSRRNLFDSRNIFRGIDFHIFVYKKWLKNVIFLLVTHPKQIDI